MRARSGSLVLLWLLAACQRQDPAPADAQRISLDSARQTTAEPLVSPDTEGATWQVAENGQAVSFGPPGGQRFLTLACRVGEEPPRLQVIRHAPARPGQKALFPVIGNGTISRFKVDASLEDGEWRWQGELPARDPLLDVFTGTRDLEATLPGGGMLKIAGSRIPSEFVTWCRTGGGTRRAQGAEDAQQAEEAASSPEPVG